MASRSLLPFLPTKTKLLQLIFGPVFKILRKHYIAPSLIFLLPAYYFVYLLIKSLITKNYKSKGDIIYYLIGLLFAAIGLTVLFIVEQIHLIKLFLQASQ